MSDGERRIARMTVCARLGKGMLMLFVLVLIIGLLPSLSRCSRPESGYIELRVQNVMIELREALHLYDVEYGRYPIDQVIPVDADVQITSRGMLLLVLMGENIRGMNIKEIRFCEFPVARNQRDGIWQDENEWVLCDFWGHEYHLLIDLKDHRIANLDTTTAPKNPFLPTGIAIFSAGPDGDPATWEDNIKSW